MKVRDLLKLIVDEEIEMDDDILVADLVPTVGGGRSNVGQLIEVADGCRNGKALQLHTRAFNDHLIEESKRARGFSIATVSAPTKPKKRRR